MQHIHAQRITWYTTKRFSNLVFFIPGDTGLKLGRIYELLLVYKVQQVLMAVDLHPVLVDIIRIFHGWEVRIEKSVRESLFGITRLCRVMFNSNPEGRIFLSAPNNYDRFFFSHTFWSPAFDFNVEVTINESRYYTLTSDLLKVDVICDVAMTNSNSLTTELRDLLYLYWLHVLLFVFSSLEGSYVSLYYRQASVVRSSVCPSSTFSNDFSEAV